MLVTMVEWRCYSLSESDGSDLKPAEADPIRRTYYKREGGVFKRIDADFYKCGREVFSENEELDETCGVRVEPPLHERQAARRLLATPASASIPLLHFLDLSAGGPAQKL